MGTRADDMALYLGLRLYGLKLLELAKRAEMTNYGVVATNFRRHEVRLERDQAEKSRAAEILQLFNCGM